MKASLNIVLLYILSKNTGRDRLIYFHLNEPSFQSLSFDFRLWVLFYFSGWHFSFQNKHCCFLLCLSGVRKLGQMSFSFKTLLICFARNTVYAMAKGAFVTQSVENHSHYSGQSGMPLRLLLCSRCKCFYFVEIWFTCCTPKFLTCHSVAYIFCWYLHI